MNEQAFRQDVCAAWEQIATDCGSVDGEGAVDHVEQIFFTLLDVVDDDLRDRVNSFDPQLVSIARDELKKYGGAQ